MHSLKEELAGLPLLTAAFACHALVVAGDQDAAAAFHRDTAWRLARHSDAVVRPGDNFPEIAGMAAWLWSAGEQYDLLDPEAQRLVLETAKRWLPPLLSAPPSETLALGALFGAARSLDSLLPELELARHCRLLRELVLSSATAGTRLANRVGGERSAAELLLLVPLGLFGVEDLLMVATVLALEAEGVAPGAPSAWLAHYYQVKGTHPGRLAELRAGLTGTSPWEAIVRLLLGAADGEGLVIRHLPRGHDHPYHRYAPERFPRDPVAGQPVEVRATLTGSEGPLYLEWYQDDIRQPDVAAVYTEPHWQEEGYWSAAMGPLPGGARVRYRLAAGGSVSQWFEFGVLTERRLKRAVGLSSADARLRVLVEDDSGRLRKVSLSLGETGALRLSFEPELHTGAVADPPDPVQPVAASASAEWPIGPFLVAIAAEPFRLTITDGGRQLLSDYRLDAWRWWEEPDGRVVMVERCLTAQPGERFYGTGERFDRLDRRGTTVLNTVYNQYKEQGARTYLPVPFLLSSAGYGLWLATDTVGELDVADSLSDRLRFTFRGAGLDLVLLLGPEPAQVVEQFTALTGRPSLPPVWAFGPWVSSNNWDSQAEVERQVALGEAYDIPSSVVVVEQWSDEATFYLVNDAQYALHPGGELFGPGEITFPEWGRWPDPKSMVAGLHEKGLKILFWQIPVWKAMNGLRHAQRDLDEAFLIRQGWVVTNADGTPYRIPEGWFANSLLIDFTNPSATAWWLSRRQYLLDEIGMDGFKTDGGEFVWEREVRFADGSTGEEGRNRYVNQYLGETYRFVQERTDGRGILFSRAGYTGAQRFPIHWAGDEASTWAALRSSLTAGLNAGLCGISFWGFDLGGFSGDIPTAELYCRSAALACFAPVMQYHAESRGQFDQDRTPWNIAERSGRPEVLDCYRFFAHLRYNLLPYLYSQAIQSGATGLPMMRPLALIHPNDPAVAAMQDQFYLGDDLLVAPVLVPGLAGRELYLPAGLWYDFWTGEALQGPARVWRPAAWDRIPVLVRAGSLIPLNLAETGRPGEGMSNGDYQGLRRLHLRVYPVRGSFKAAWNLSPAARVEFQGAFDGARLELTASGLTIEAVVEAYLTGPKGRPELRTAQWTGTAPLLI